ncbi:PBSX phage terminase large subunit-like [Procambarus clarkii]|uniref:PBSX phage terminase large subunit-like n=1 Tax=Procambarus clarkii TaxID=6728 RepID=UPI00374336E5
MDELGIRHLFKTTVSPLEITYIKTGQKIVFLGCDDPTKVKSIKFEHGYPAIVWFEELDQFTGMEEIRNLNQSLLRGGDKFWAFYSYNPPKSKNNWVNEEMLIDKPNRKVYHSTYLGVPKEWLGELFFIEAEQLKETKEMAYRHEYLGEATGTGGSVFENVIIREITDEEISRMDKFYYGCDFGYSVDPAAWGKFYVHNNKLYILDEIYQVKLTNKMLAEKIKAKGCREVVTFDSSEPKSIQDMREYGINAMGAKKGPDSVEYGMKYLQDFDEIIIDPKRTPNAAKEFIGYEYEMNKDGQFISRYPDKNNHFIDCARYALEWFIINRRGKLDIAR